MYVCLPARPTTTTETTKQRNSNQRLDWRKRNNQRENDQDAKAMTRAPWGQSSGRTHIVPLKARKRAQPTSKPKTENTKTVEIMWRHVCYPLCATRLLYWWRALFNNAVGFETAIAQTHLRTHPLWIAFNSRASEQPRAQKLASPTNSTATRQTTVRNTPLTDNCEQCNHTHDVHQFHFDHHAGCVRTRNDYHPGFAVS